MPRSPNHRYTDLTSTWQTPRTRPIGGAVVGQAEQFLRNYPDFPNSSGNHPLVVHANALDRNLRRLGKEMVLWHGFYGGVAHDLPRVRPLMEQLSRGLGNPGLESEHTTLRSGSFVLDSVDSSVRRPPFRFSHFGAHRINIRDVHNVLAGITDVLHLRFLNVGVFESAEVLDLGWVAPNFSSRECTHLASPHEAIRNRTLAHLWSFHEAHALAVQHSTAQFGPLEPGSGWITFIVRLIGRGVSVHGWRPSFFRKETDSPLSFDAPQGVEDAISCSQQRLEGWLFREASHDSNLKDPVVRGGRPQKNGKGAYRR